MSERGAFTTQIIYCVECRKTVENIIGFPPSDGIFSGRVTGSYPGDAGSLRRET